MQQHPFSEQELALGRKCFLQDGVLSIEFSGGTYQAEVADKKDLFWPFFRLNEEGKIIDSFCSCQEEGFCLHVVAAYLAVFKGKEVPLHMRFIRSFWHKLTWLAYKKFGHRADRLLYFDRWEARALSEEVLFWIKSLNQEGEKKLEEVFLQRPLETEETSLKFFDLEEEDLMLWRQGRPKDTLSYELSFWADLSKWFLQEEEEGIPYQIAFFPEDSLPTQILVHLHDVECSFQITEKDWLTLVPFLQTVQSPLVVKQAEECLIKSIKYDVEQKRD